MSFWAEQKVYAQHVLALFRPGAIGPVHTADPNEPGSLKKWDESERRLLIEEGRRQLDRQVDDLERVRSRSQILLVLALALTATTGSLLSRMDRVDGLAPWLVWSAALVLGGWAVLGAAATSVVAAKPETIHATVLSRYESPIEPKLAEDYAVLVIAGEEHVAVRLTNLRWAIAYLLACGALTLSVWAWTIGDTPAPEPGKSVLVTTRSP
jgi:hypothetical protein